LDADWARANSSYETPVIHGVLTAALVSRPTVNFLQKNQIESVTIYHAAKFVAPVRVGDTVTHKLTVIKVDLEKRRIIFSTEVKNQNGIVVMVGEAHEKIIE
jgi:3-hydroxybutyryl-CoA dehydratase